MIKVKSFCFALGCLVLIFNIVLSRALTDTQAQLRKLEFEFQIEREQWYITDAEVKALGNKNYQETAY